MSQVPDTIQSKPRTPATKGASRQLRAQGWAPAVVYGAGVEPYHLSVDSHVLVGARRVYGRAHTYNVEVEGGKGFKAIIKDVQLDPVSRQLLHVDLQAVDEKTPVKARVPVALVGKARGVAMGGQLQYVLREAQLVGVASKLPDIIEVDVSAMDVGSVVHLNDLPLPDGVRLATRHNGLVVRVVGGRQEVEEEPAAAAAEAAPAADAKAKK